MILKPTILLALTLVIAASAFAQEPRIITGVTLVSDAFVQRPVKEEETIFYAYDQKLIEGKLNEYGQKFPENVKLTPAKGGLFILLLSDTTKECFKSLSYTTPKFLIIDLGANNDAKPPKPKDAQHKTSRLFLIQLRPVKGLTGWAVNSAKEERRTVPTKELKGE